MIEFKLGGRRLRLNIDGVLETRAIWGGRETKKETWNVVTFCVNEDGYLYCCMMVDGVKKIILKHRLLYLARNPEWDIFNSSQNNHIDHINRDRIDNTSGNLRVVTCQQNSFNRNTKGYSWTPKRKRWKAEITVNGKSTFIGYFVNEEDAAAAYLEAKARLHIIPVS